MDVDIDGVIYSVKMADCVYRISTNNAVIDQGANGGIAGQDCQVIEVNDQPHQYVNMEGIDGHVMERRRLVTAGAVTNWNGMELTSTISLHESVVNSDLSLLTVSAFPSISDVAFHTSTCAHTLIKSGRSYHMSS
jgi:hypothetical protein